MPLCLIRFKLLTDVCIDIPQYGKQAANEQKRQETDIEGMTEHWDSRNAKPWKDIRVAKHFKKSEKSLN